MEARRSKRLQSRSISTYQESPLNRTRSRSLPRERGYVDEIQIETHVTVRKKIKYAISQTPGIQGSPGITRDPGDARNEKPTAGIIKQPTGTSNGKTVTFSDPLVTPQRKSTCFPAETAASSMMNAVHTIIAPKKVVVKPPEVVAKPPEVVAKPPEIVAKAPQPKPTVQRANFKIQVPQPILFKQEILDQEEEAIEAATSNDDGTGLEENHSKKIRELEAQNAELKSQYQQLLKANVDQQKKIVKFYDAKIAEKEKEADEKIAAKEKEIDELRNKHRKLKGKKAKDFH
jgi:hypothetical protein